MTTTRLANAADAARWDAFVVSHPRCSAYHRWAYRQAMEDAYGLRTLYRLAEDSAGRIIGILPLARIPRPFGNGPICSLPYCDLGGPLGIDEEVEQALVDQACGEEDSAIDVRSTAKADPEELQTIEEGAKVRLLLSLPKSSEELLASFKSKHRSQINKARKNGLTVSVDSGKALIDEFFPVYSRNMRDLGSPTHSKRWFEAIAARYGDACLIGRVRLNDKVIGSGIVLLCGEQAVIPWASTLREYNHLAPNMLLYWALLERVTDLGHSLFDFGRSTYGEGTYKFKTQWGAKPVPLHWYAAGMDTIGNESDRNSSSSSTLRKVVERVWRTLPLPVSILIGSSIRPWISL